MRVVADASVAVKWFLPSERADEHGEKAAALLEAVREGRMSLLQPPHWLAEVAAVLSRLSPSTARDDMTLLIAMRFQVLASSEVYTTACKLAIAAKEHVFDTLYHAVSLLAPDALLVTADERYYRKASKFGSILLLGDFDAGQTKNH